MTFCANCNHGILDQPDAEKPAFCSAECCLAYMEFAEPRILEEYVDDDINPPAGFDTTKFCHP